MTDVPVLPPPEPLADDTIELRLLRILGPDDAAQRSPVDMVAASPPAVALGLGPELCRYAVHCT
jgi:hypothetical protein